MAYESLLTLLLTVVMVGVNLHPMNVDLSPIWHQEVDLIGSMAHGTEVWPLGTGNTRSTFSIASDLITNRLLHPEQLITHRCALSNFREALQFASDKKHSRAIKVIFDAALLPASSVPTARPSSHTRLPRLTGGASRQKLFGDEEITQPIPQLTSASQDAPATGPSHFTMAQSEDFTADFDNAQFIAPKPQRPPTPLMFRSASDIPETPQPIGPSDATISLPQTLQKAEEPGNNPMSAHSSE